MNSEEKIASLREMLADDPDDGDMWYMLGRELIQAERYSEAAEALTKCVKLSPKYTAAWRELGRACEKAGVPAKAKSAYENGIAVAQETKDMQTEKEMKVFLRKIEKREAAK